MPGPHRYILQRAKNCTHSCRDMARCLSRPDTRCRLGWAGCGAADTSSGQAEIVLNISHNFRRDFPLFLVEAVSLPAASAQRVENGAA